MHEFSLGQRVAVISDNYYDNNCEDPTDAYFRLAGHFEDTELEAVD